MIEGLFGQVERGKAVGWAYDTSKNQSVSIQIKSKNRLIAEGVANLERNDLIEVASHLDGKAGFKISLPKGRKNWSKIEIYANGELLPKSPQLQMKIDKTQRTLSLSMDDPHFFIHIPKTAGTAFKKLLEAHFDHDAFFPSSTMVKENNGLYPHFNQIIKYERPTTNPNILIGHFPFATHQMIKGKVTKTVILRDPVQRAISNIFHMKNYDKRMKGLSPMEVYRKSKWHYHNFQIRYLTDKGIKLNMKFVDVKPLTEKDLRSAIANMRTCNVVGISEQLDRTVLLTNKIYGWNLEMPKRVNVARTEKTISDELLQLLIKENELEQKLYAQAINRFERLCKEFGV